MQDSLFLFVKSFVLKASYDHNPQLEDLPAAEILTFLALDVSLTSLWCLSDNEETKVMFFTRSITDCPFIDVQEQVEVIVIV